MLRFGSFELDEEAGQLRRDGTVLRLPPQPFRLLVLLVSRPGELITREEIRQQLWGSDTYVDFDQGVNFCIKQVRSVLHDDADRPLYVETVRAAATGSSRRSSGLEPRRSPSRDRAAWTANCSARSGPTLPSSAWRKRPASAARHRHRARGRPGHRRRHRLDDDPVRSVAMFSASRSGGTGASADWRASGLAAT